MTRSLLILILLVSPAIGQDWPQFRGTNAAGVADDYPLVASWDVKAKTNVRWKAKIPGMGHACPVVSGNQVFIVTAQGAKPEGLKIGLYGDPKSVKNNPAQNWFLISVSKHTGDELWRFPLRAGVPKVKRHAKSTHANSTPATDGYHIVVLLGSGDLFCFNVCGELLWKKQLGVLDAGWFRVPADQWGYGSSPIIYQDRVIVQCDIQKNSFLAAYDLADGRQLWRTPRNDVPTWSTPTIFTSRGRTEVVVNGFKHAGGYDPMTGKPLWRLNGGGDIPVPTPVVAHGMVLLSSAHGSLRPLLAIKGGATGLIQLAKANGSQHVAWYNRRSGVYMPTPIVYKELLYTCRINGLLACYDFKTGKVKYRKRLGRGATSFTSSPVAGDGKVFFTAENGSVYVLQAGPTFKLLATNQMEEICMSSPAISDGMLLMRTKDHLVSIGSPPPPPSPRRRRFRLLRLLLRR